MKISLPDLTRNSSMGIAATGSRTRSLAQERFEIPAASNHAENPHFFTIDSVNDHVLADREGTQTWTKVLALTPSARVHPKEKESRGYGIDETVCSVDTGVGRNVVPELVDIGFSLWCEAMRPQ